MNPNSTLRLALILIGLLANSFSSSAQVYAIYTNMLDNFNNYLGTIDPVTGVVSPVGQSPILPEPSAEKRVHAINPAQNHYYFINGDSISTVDLSTGLFVSRKLISLAVNQSPFDVYFHPFSQQLYTVFRDNTNLYVWLRTLDPTTGGTTLVSPSPVGERDNFNASSFGTLDPNLDRFYFLLSDDTLAVMDLSNGAILAKNKIDGVDFMTNYALEYNRTDSTLYAMATNTNVQETHLMRIDPMTGLETQVSANGIADGFSYFFTEMDHVNQEFYFLNSNDSIFRVDLTTGMVISKTKMDLSSIPLVIDGFAIGPVNTSVSPIAQAPEVHVFPNPWSHHTVVELPLAGPATLRLVDLLGQTVFERNTTGARITLDRQQLPAGVYFLTLEQGRRSAQTVKLVIRD